MAKSKTITVKKVLDGDTFVTENNEKIRIAGVDTPEKGKPGAARARTYLKNQIDGDRIVIKPVAKDKYRRTVAHVYKDGRSVGKKIKKRRF